jgi:hypothetical protein
MTVAILTIVSSSSRVAPAASASRMWRQAPVASRLVQATLTATETSSTSRLGRTSPLQGFALIA